MIQEQVQILNELSKYLYSSIEVNFDFVKFEYKFNSEEEWDLISTYYTKSGKKFPPDNFSELMDKLKPLCEKLHDLMKEQTGGNWQKFVLTIDENREVQTEFSYEPQSLYDD